MPITPIQQATGTFEANSGSVTLAATEAGSQVVIVAGLVGVGGGSNTSISTPAGFSGLGQATGGGDTDHFARVSAFIKPSASVGETSWTLTLTNGASRLVAWAAFELSGVDADWSQLAYLPNSGNLGSGTSTTVTSATVTQFVLSETFAGLSIAMFLATDTGGSTPAISAHSNGFLEIASQSATDAGSRAATLSVATKTELSVNTPTCAVTVSPSSYVGTYFVTLTGTDSRHAANITAMSGFEIGTATGIATTGLGFVTGTLAPFDTVTGSPAVVATSPRSGTYCLELSASAAAEHVTWRDEATGLPCNLKGATVDVWSWRLHVYFPTSLPSADTDLASVEAGSLANGVIVRYVSASQKLGVKIGSGTEQLSDATVSANQWIGVDLLYDPRTTTHTCAWQVDYNAATSDATAPVAQASASTAGMTAAGVTTVRHGWTTATTATVRYDDSVGSRFRKTYPIGDTRVVPLKATGTPTVSGSSGNFRVRQTDGTLAAWTAAATVAALDDLPPTIGASADVLVQITNAATEYVEVPMETFTLAPDFVPIAGRWSWAGWAASGNPAAFRFQIDDGTGVGWSIWGETVDAGFDDTALVWMGGVHNKNAALNNFYQLSQAILDALVARFGFSGDALPDTGVHCVLFELAVQPAQALPLFGQAGSGDVVVEVATDLISNGVVAIVTTTPAGKSATITYETNTTPTSYTVDPSTTDTRVLNAPDMPTTNKITIGLSS